MPFTLTTTNFAIEAPIEELSLASRASDANEWKLYIRWELAYLFTRVRSFDDELLTEILKYSTPQSGSGPPEAAAAAARSYARDCVRQLTELLAEAHREFAVQIVDRTEVGKLFKDRASHARQNRTERPRIDTSELASTLLFSPEDVKALWYPLHFAISGRYFDQDRTSDRYADVRTVLSSTSAWIIREFINLHLLGPADRGISNQAGMDIISRSAESVDVELTRWPEISSSLQRRLEGWQTTLIQRNSYPTRVSPQCEHYWMNLINKAPAMGSLSGGAVPAPLRMRNSQSPTKQTPIVSPEGYGEDLPGSAGSQSNYVAGVPDRASSYGGSVGGRLPVAGGSGSAYDEQVERLRTQTQAFRPIGGSISNQANTSRRLEHSPQPPSASMNMAAAGYPPVGGGYENLNSAGSGSGGSGQQGNHVDAFLQQQLATQDQTIANAVLYFQREQQRLVEVKQALRELEKQQEQLTATYKHQMEDLDRRKREAYDDYLARKAAPPVSVPTEVINQLNAVGPQHSTVRFNIGEGEAVADHASNVAAAVTSEVRTGAGVSPGIGAGQHQQQHHHHNQQQQHHGGRYAPQEEYHDDDEGEWEPEPQNIPQRRNTTGGGNKLQKMHPEFADGGHPGSGTGGNVNFAPNDSPGGKPGKGGRGSWIQRARDKMSR